MIKKSKQAFIVLYFLVVSFIITSCADETRLFDENKEIPALAWDYKTPLQFDINIADTTKYYNLFINLRINGDYKYSNLFMWVSETLPDKSVSKERVEFVLADDRGKWLGNSLGNLYSYQLQFKPRIKFKQQGIHVFTLEQNMRDDILQNVQSAGVRVEFWSKESKAW